MEAPDVSDRETVGEPAYRSVDAPDAPAESDPVTETSASEAPERIDRELLDRQRRRVELARSALGDRE